jgi:outer membrane biosynthesis protein TonB
MDERTLVPAMLPIVVLDGHSSIPTNLPLDSISKRVVVPRDINREAYGVKEDHSIPAQPSDLDERVTVPLGSQLPEIVPPPEFTPPDIVSPDVFTSGEVHLVAQQPKEETAKWDAVKLVASIAFHIVLLIAFIELFAHRKPPDNQDEIARRMTLLLPPGAFELNQPRSTPAPPAPHVRLDPREIRKVAPPTPTPEPPKAPETPRELPAAPIPKPSVAQSAPQDAPAPKVELPKPTLRLETPDTPVPHPQLTLPKDTTSGHSIEDLFHGSAEKPNGPAAIGEVGPIHRGGSQGRGGGIAGGSIEMLTPDEGVDFSGYLQRVYYTVKRNWFAVMPASVELGEKGVVQLTFRINRDGSVPSGDPVIGHNSGKEPLDRAAYSSVRASNPFEGLPPQFSGPYIELRYTYYYNIMPGSLGQ